MKHKIKIIALLLISIFILSGCGKKNDNFVVIEQDGPVNTEQIIENTIFEPELFTPEINPLDEEFPGDMIPEEGEELNSFEDPNTFNDTNTYPEQDYSFDGTTHYPHPGSTPIAILPADLPTPTPRQALQFTYQEYMANSLNLKFEAPTGWEINENIQDTFILNEPAANQRDGYSASITVRAVAVSKDYNNSDLIREIKQQLEQLGSTNYDRWSPSLTASRELLGADGVYANYSGTLVTGVKVRGRLHVACVNKVLYTIHFSQPSEYNNDYITAYTKLRRSLKFIN